MFIIDRTVGFVVNRIIGNFFLEIKAHKKFRDQKLEEAKRQTEKKWEEWREKNPSVKRDSKTDAVVYNLFDDAHNQRKCKNCEGVDFICEFQYGGIANMQCCKCGKILRIRDGGTSARKAVVITKKKGN